MGAAKWRCCEILDYVEEPIANEWERFKK